MPAVSSDGSGSYSQLARCSMVQQPKMQLVASQDAKASTQDGHSVTPAADERAQYDGFTRCDVPCRPVDLGLALLSEGLAKLHPTFEPQRVANGEQLAAAEAAAREKRLKVRSSGCLGPFYRHYWRDLARGVEGTHHASSYGTDHRRDDRAADRFSSTAAICANLLLSAAIPTLRVGIH